MDSSGTSGARTVFVIPMENNPSSKIYGNSAAPYINGLINGTSPATAYATNFQDELTLKLSEPHYMFMEGGTNAYTDHTFSTDSDPSSSNSTSSTAHLVTQLTAASIPWMSYQEGITSGTCPIATDSTNFYAPKHNPVVFYKDVVGSTPSSSAPVCSAHHKAYSDFAGDLASGITGYVFITPNLCHDMHGSAGCPTGTSGTANITAGDTWLSTELPRIIAYTQTHEALIFVTWDESEGSGLMAFLAIGSHIKGGAVSTTLTHGSMLKTTEEYLGVSPISTVSALSDFAVMFDTGAIH